METLSVKEFQNTGIKYLTFSNQNGKRWSIPMENMRVALELYEPSGMKGKLLKRLFPISTKVGVTKRILHGSYTTVEMSEELIKILIKCFGEKWEYSVFWGTPCVDRKITIQIYRGKNILGYCKIGNSKRVKDLFEHEKNVLDLLQQKDMDHVSRCLTIEQLTNGSWVLVQSTEKVVGVGTEHDYGVKQSRFLEKLWKTTKETLLFEKTDYYQSLLYLEQHLDLIDDEYRGKVKETLDQVISYYKDKEVEWGVSHRDFTPWNTCVVGKELFVFDFEYALMNAPKGIDRWHFFVQTKCFEKKCDAKQIAEEYLKMSKEINDDILFKCYILDIVSFYLSRNGEDDLDTALIRTKILNNVLV